MSFSSGYDFTELLAQLPLYSSRMEVESIFSVMGVDVRLDDDDDGVVSPPGTGPNAPDEEEDRLTHAIAEATDLVNGYLAQHYSPTNLALVRRVRRWTSWIAAHILSRRRANPGLFCDEYERALEEMQLILEGKQILFGVPKSGQHMPMMSNFVINRNFRTQPQRVDQGSSVNRDVPPQNDNYVYFGYW